MADVTLAKHGCHVLKRHIAADPDPKIPEVIDQFGPRARPVSAAEILGEEADQDVVSEIDETLTIIEVEEPDTKRELIELLTSEEILASFIHAAGFVSHWQFAPGTDPLALGPYDFPEPHSGEDAVVAVVDSGILPRGLPSWLAGANVIFDPEDEETSSPSHGTFVSGLLRQLSPYHRVSLTKARAVPTTSFEQRPPDPNHRDQDPPVLTTEIHVYEAIIRLILRARRHEHEPDALNLSLGAYTCEEDETVLALEKAIERWRREFGEDSPIFAAGGNAKTQARFFPAALRGVKAVAAAAHAGAPDETVVWDGQKQPHSVAATARPWIDNVAPGIAVVNVGAAGQTVSWSGSSFASAIAAGLYLRGEQPTPVNNIDWWLANPVDYSQIQDLTYMDPSTGGPVTAP